MQQAQMWEHWFSPNDTFRRPPAKRLRLRGRSFRFGWPEPKAPRTKLQGAPLGSYLFCGKLSAETP